jgi:hypothetical protein
MRFLLRTLLYLSLVVWLGAEVFFAVVANVSFTTLRPDTHTAGAILCKLLPILHRIGLVAGTATLILLLLAPFVRLFKPRMVWAPMTLLLLMMLLTAYSQVAIVPAMARDGLAADKAVKSSDTANPGWIDFSKLHLRAEQVEEAVLLLGLATAALGAATETATKT